MHPDDRLWLMPAPGSARFARQFVADELVKLELHELIDDVSIIVTELVNNAAVHAGSGCGLDLCERFGRVRLSVKDHSQAMPVRRRVSEWSERGRGLAMVESVGTSWGVEVSPWGKRIWVDFDPLRPIEAFPSSDPRAVGLP